MRCAPVDLFRIRGVHTLVCVLYLCPESSFLRCEAPLVRRARLCQHGARNSLRLVAPDSDTADGDTRPK